MSPLVVEFLGVVVRWVITSCGAYLVAKHVINSDQEAQFADGALQYVLAHLTIWGPTVVALLWGLSAKYTSRLRFLAALDLPAGASEDSAKALAKTDSVKSQAFSGVVGVLLACALGAGAMTLPACASVQTHVSPVADIANAAGKVEESAHVILVEAQKANQIPNPLKPGEVLVNRGNLDRVAIAVNKLGHLGLDLDAALGDYNAAKAAGKDLTAVRAVVSKVLVDISTALGDVGKAIPNGTLAAVDQAVGSILGILATVNGVVGL